MNVLIADDNGEYRRLLQRTLEQWGYTTILAADGAAAWDVLQRADAPEMAIVDWMMPGIDGIDLVKRLRARDNASYTYVLLLTSRSELNDVELGLYAGSDDYLTKPFELPELKARLFAGSRVLQLHHKLHTTIEKLDQIARHDSLTQLLNRKAILAALADEMERARRGNGQVGVMMIDVDYFKKVNDVYGHPTGDAVLTEVAQRLKASIRTYDSAGRYGGEEFLICLPSCDSAAAAEIAERIRLGICGNPVAAEGHSLSVSVSIGVADSTTAPDWEDLIRCADEALYAAKRAGRNRVSVHRDGLDEDLEEHGSVASSLAGRRGA
jgi:two-component system cell cycle response regulator